MIPTTKLINRSNSNLLIPQLWQQVRFIKNPVYNTHLFNYRYGRRPIISEDDLGEVDVKSLDYEKIRPAMIWQTGSAIVDPVYERFITMVMSGGRREHANKLMTETFYNIKLIQFPKLLRQKERKASTSTSRDGTVNSSNLDNTELENGGEEEDGEEQKQVEVDPMKIFKTGLKNCEPFVITKRIKRGGASYHVPHPLVPDQMQYISMKWMLEAVKERPKPRLKHFPEVLARELIEAFHKTGKVIKRRDDMHRLADANKAYAHYRWG